MIPRSIRAVAMAAGAALGLAACSTYDGYGYGGSYYGARVSYSDGPGYGWYNDYYYPGQGYYVYDRAGKRHSWNAQQRSYWLSRSNNRADRREVRQNFREYRTDRQQDRAAYRAERRNNRDAVRNGTISREAFRAEQRSDRRAFRTERRSDQRELRRDNRRAIRD